MAEGSKGGRQARPGAHPLRREVIAHHQRERILVGAAKAFAERGYRDASVTDIVRSAVIGRARFYDNFSSKEDCFFALYDSATESALGVVSEACQEGPPDFPGRVRTGLGALLAHLQADPAAARACIVEGPAVGPAIGQRFEHLIGEFAALLRRSRIEAADAAEEMPLPETVEETVVGGLYWLLYHALLEGKPKRIEKLLPQLTEFSLIPFIGAEGARTATS